MLQHIIESTDWTNTPERQQMAQEYYDFCQSFMENIEKCRELLNQKMLVEAVDLANRQEIPLPRQLELLKFKGIEDYRVLCLIYEWPNPPELDGSVLEQMKNMMQDAENLQPLLSAFRQVVRSDNVKMKILLLRRLVKMDHQKSGEWKKALNQQESLLMEQLIRQAKNMILEKNFGSLQQLHQEMTDPEWTITPPDQVVRKIESVLEEHRLEELKKEAVICLDKINEAYSSFDFESLGEALSEWKDLISGKAYQPDKNERKQVEEAEGYWLQQHKKQQEENMFNSLLQRLSQLLGSNGSQEEMDMIYNQLTLIGKQLPENIMQQYFYTKENYEIIQRRKRITKNIVIAFCAVLLIAVIGFSAHLIIRHNTEQKWAKQLEKALTEQPTSAVALDMIRNLKKDDPVLCKSPAISALINRAEKMFETEELKRKDFTKLGKEIRLRLKSYEENRIKLKKDFSELEKLVVDQKEKVVMKELSAELAAQEDLFQIRQKKQFDNLIGQIGRKRGQFYTFLEGHHFKSAGKLLEEISRLEDSAARIYEFIRNIIPGRESDFAQSEELRKILVREQVKFQDISIITKNINAPSSVDNLVVNVKEYLRSLPKSKLVPDLKKLQESVVKAKESVKVLNEKVPVANNVFSKHLEDVLKYRKNSNATAKKIIEHFQKLDKYFDRTPIYAIVGKSKDNVIYDFYYTKNGIHISQLNNKFDIVLKVIANDNGKTMEVRLIYSLKNRRKIEIVKPNEDRLECDLIYPAPEDAPIEALRYYSNIAPHIKSVKNILQMLQDGNKDDIEPTLVKVFEFLLKDKDESVNCHMKTSLIELIYKFMAPLDEKNPSYRDFSTKFKFNQAGQINWLETYEKPDMQKKLRKNIAAVSESKLVSRQTVSKEVWDKLVSLKLTPAGFITRNSEKRVFHPFPGLPEEGELWLIPFSPDSSIIVIGKYKGNTVSLLPGAANLDVNYSVLLTPTVSSSTEKLNKEIWMKLQSPEISMPLLSWPVFANKEKKEN